MRALTAFLLCTGLLFSSARADELSYDPDPWFGQDKWIHFGASIGLSGVGYGVSSLVLEEPWQRAISGAGFSLLIGGLKELADATNGSVASGRDMTWNIIGTVVGTGISLGLDYLLRDIL
jgi:putative lipoprotein